MKKLNYNIVVFIISSILIIAGWFSIALLEGVKDSVEDFIKKPNLSKFVENIDETSKQVSYKGLLIDISSFTEYIKGTRVIEKADSTIARLDNGYLTFVSDGCDIDTVSGMADNAHSLKQAMDELNIPLLYVMAPTKSYFDSYPNVEKNEFYESYCLYRELLRSRKIHVLDLAEKMEEQSLDMEDMYFITDHHWIPEAGLWAAQEVYDGMCKDKSIEDNSLYDLKNYNIEVYQDFFLGSQGKKVGRYFTPLGLDDFSVITPNFETSLTVTDSQGTYIGTFDETVIRREKLNAENLYYSNPYVGYSGGDYPLQVIVNNYADELDKKVIVLRDSFSCVVTPFLSLATKELHTIDVRHWEGIPEAKTITEYIKLQKPDYVVILYSDLIPTMLEFE